MLLSHEPTVKQPTAAGATNLHIPDVTQIIPKGAETVFRVTGIPITATLHDLVTVLSTEFSSEPGIDLDTSQTTLCPSCYDDRTYTALIQFAPSSPPLLENLCNNDTYQIDFGTGCDISIGKDFYGLTQLYPTAGPIKADVVVVCGLNGHAYGSWAGKADHHGRKKMWLRHFLPEDLPRCRTMIYGYNSKLADSSIHSIPDYTNSFLEELKKARRLDEEKNRPIIFIGHSFGGIIIAQSLVKAKENEARYSQIFASTKATIFFGTPHRGLVVDDILAMIGDSSPREDLVTSLERGSQELANVLKRFINYSTSINLKIVNFTETQQTRKLVQDSNGRWSRNGEPFTAVESQSSILQLPDSIEETLAVEGDHSSLVKFKHRGHTTYTSVIRYLEDFTLDTGVERCLTAYSAVNNGSTRDLERIFQNTTANVNKPVRHMGRATTLLHMAVDNGDKATVSLLLKHGADTELVDGDGQTPLQLAAYGGDEKIVELLLINGAEIAAQSEGTFPALYLAAAGGSERVVEILLKNGAPFGEGKGNATELHAAAAAGHEKVVEVLVKSGADIEAKQQNNWTALQCAVLTRQAGVVKVLLENGADSKIKDGENRTLLHFAAMTESGEEAEVLVKNGADIEARGGDDCTPLFTAALSGHERVVEALVKGGADMMAHNLGSSMTALEVAARYGREGVVEILLSNGANTEVTNDSNWTPLCSAARDGHEKIVEMLVSNGANIHVKCNYAKSNSDWTPLHLAARNGNEKVVGDLVKNGADVAAKTSYDRTAIFIATKYGNDKAINVLLENGADITTMDDDGSTLLHYAAANGHDKAVEVLVKHGADMSAKDTSGGTALHYSAAYGHDKAVEALLSAGADFKVRNKLFLRPLHLATLKGHKKAVAALKKAGA